MNLITAEEAKKRTAWAKAGNFKIEDALDIITRSVWAKSMDGYSAIKGKVSKDIEAAVIQRLTKLGYKAKRKGASLLISW